MPKRPQAVKKLTSMEKSIVYVLRHRWKFAIAGVAFLGTSGTLAAFDIMKPGLPVLHFELAPIEYQTKELGTTVDRLVLIDLEAKLAKAQADEKAAPNDTTQKAITVYEKIIKNTKARICKANPADCE
jgi:hypothetical protein